MEFNNSYTGLRQELVEDIHGSGKVVLDVGCATGANGAYLLDKGIAKEVYGIELDSQMAVEARQKYNEVFVGNLDDDAMLDKLDNLQFDAIICGDILEHLDNPWGVLQKFSTALKPGGTITVSLPNIQHIDVFIHLYFKNTWPVNTRGIFDKTHKRFFTFNDIKKLVDDAGLEIIKVKRNFRFRDKLGSRFPVYGLILKKLFKRLYTFQYIIVCGYKNALS